MPEHEIALSPDPDEAKRLQQRLAGARKLLKQIGTLLVADSRRAFQDQKFGDILWPEKYPGSPRPFLSIAGIVQDFSEGNTKPRPESLADRPALHRTGALRNSPAYHPIGDDALEVGSQIPYATLHQQGGWSSQPITEDMKKRMEDWLSSTKTRKIFAPDFISYDEFASWAKARGYVFRGNKSKKRSKSGKETVVTSATVKTRSWGSKRPITTETMTAEDTEIAKFRPRLEFLLGPRTTVLETQVNRRPFIGITAQRADQVGELISEFLLKPFNKAGG